MPIGTAEGAYGRRILRPCFESERALPRQNRCSREVPRKQVVRRPQTVTSRKLRRIAQDDTLMLQRAHNAFRPRTARFT